MHFLLFFRLSTTTQVVSGAGGGSLYQSRLHTVFFYHICIVYLGIFTFTPHILKDVKRRYVHISVFTFYSSLALVGQCLGISYAQHVAILLRCRSRYRQVLEKLRVGGMQTISVGGVVPLSTTKIGPAVVVVEFFWPPISSPSQLTSFRKVRSTYLFTFQAKKIRKICVKFCLEQTSSRQVPRLCKFSVLVQEWDGSGTKK